MQSLYLTTTESHCGRSLVSLGILETVSRTTQRIGIFRPIINPRGPNLRDKNTDLLLKHFKLNIPYKNTYVFTHKEANHLLANRQEDTLLARIIHKYRDIKEKFDFILCIGRDHNEETSFFEPDLDAEIARSLECPVLILANAHRSGLDGLLTSVDTTLSTFNAKGCPVVGVIVNRVDFDQMERVQKGFKDFLSDENLLVFLIPNDELLASPTIREIAEQLDAKVLYGRDKLNRLAYQYMVIAMQMQNYLARLKPHALLVTPGDRGEIILSALQAQQSTQYPPLAGLILATGEQPAPTVKRLLDGLPSILPILSVEDETFETVTKLNQIHSYITPDNPNKIETGKKLFEKHIDMDAVFKRFGLIQFRGMPPKRFLYNLMLWARANKKHIVLPESTDPRILKATETLLERDIVDITLFGNREEIISHINQLGLSIDLKKLSIIDPASSPIFETYAQTLYELRKHKGMTPELARETMYDISYFATMMVYKGQADGMVSGAVHTTAHTIRPAFQIIKTKPGVSLVSSVFFMCLEDRVLIYGDCAVVPIPTAEELSEIAITSAETAKAFGILPRVALLSYSSGSSGAGEEVERVRKATEIARKKRPDLLFEGPIQYDAAVDEKVGQAKMPGSKVAGRATVLIFPDLNTGNNTYKAVQRETGAIAIGPVLQGLNKPVNDLSRGCTVEDIINTVAITAVQAQHP